MTVMVDCMYCGAEVNPDGKDTYSEVTGFTHPRSGGGPNSIALRTTTGRYSCNTCVERLKSGVSPNQGSLLD
jgi:hypothetical protein